MGTALLIGGSGAGWEGTALLHHGSYIKVSLIGGSGGNSLIDRRESSAFLAMLGWRVLCNNHSTLLSRPVGGWPGD